MFEGSIIRVMRRMSELLKQVPHRRALTRRFVRLTRRCVGQLELGAAAIGDKDLEDKFKAPPRSPARVLCRPDASALAACPRRQRRCSRSLGLALGGCGLRWQTGARTAGGCDRAGR